MNNDSFEDLSPETLDHTINNAFKTRMKTIEVLRQYAREADSIHQGCAESNRSANVTGAIGGFGTALGGLTIATGGLAAPMVLGGLALCGTVFSVGGGAWCIKNEYDKRELYKDLENEIVELLHKDNDEVKKMESICRMLDGGYFGKTRKLVFRASHTWLAALGGLATIHGSETALKILTLAIPRIASFISDKTHLVLFSLLGHSSLIATKCAVEGVEVAAEQSAASAVMFMKNGVSKDFVKQDALVAAQKAYEKVFEEVMENAVGEAANKAAKKGGDIAARHAARKAAKEAAAEAAKETATQAAKGAAKTTAEASAKTAAKVTGSVTAVFGVLTCAWEGYNAYQNHYEMKKESQLGRELRELAKRMEKALKNMLVRINIHESSQTNTSNEL